MIRPRMDVAVFLCVAPVDMRKQAASLALLVEQSLQGNIFEPAIYAFANRRADRVKLIYWERNGLAKPSTKDPRRRIRTTTTLLSVASLEWS